MTLDGTRTFIVGRKRPVVIDPGPADPAHQQAILTALGGHRPVAILLTHAHDDHAAGAGALREQTGAPIHMGRDSLRTLSFSVDAWLQEGDIIEVDGARLTALHTPGHTPEHFTFLYEASDGSRAAFVGDLLMGEGATALIAEPEGDVAAYLASLDRLEALDANILYPAHGPPLENPREAIATFRAHRRERVQQVRDLLGREGEMSLEAIVERIYGTGLDASLRGAAEGSVGAILRYLGGPGSEAR